MHEGNKEFLKQLDKAIEYYNTKPTEPHDALMLSLLHKERKKQMYLEK